MNKLVFVMKHVLLNSNEGGHRWRTVVSNTLFQFQLLSYST